MHLLDYRRRGRNSDTWQWILALAFGGVVGLAFGRGLIMMFGKSGSALSVSTVTASSMLGGFCGAVTGWVMSSPKLSQDVQTLVMFGILGVMAAIAADATAAQASMSAEDLVRVRRRALVHIAIGIGAALIALALASAVIQLAGP